ncbi:methyltransferase [Shimia sp. R11_0]|uniref:50S ribosomal protein L11 methyltransferase n=1 Tax=Shimia sp. R11_0 TaxID=2821096 RepID=UPI001ADB508D|nr:50S ribosomal protein L11 methyltransferase [Shimia sp. R11_0]MBO9479575.1 methyltransferase [Shimia sp. R11_0]
MLDRDNVEISNRFRPSDYTAALIQCLLADQRQAKWARVLEVGCGSGVLLSAAGAAGAAQLTGVDIEADAVAATTRLLDHNGHAAISDIHEGEMFAPVRNRRFDLVLANLPHFPMNPAAIDGRLPSWSAGGADGRKLLDSFLDNLSPHLASGGRALVAHNVFIGLDTTKVKAAKLGLSVRVIDSLFVPLPQEKLAVMTPDILKRETGHSIHRFGCYAFGEVAVLSLAHASSPGDYT